MAVQYYGNTHLEPNTKYTVTLDLPGIYKQWSFISQLVTDINQVPVYCGAKEILNDLKHFADGFTREEIFFAIRDASNRLEDFMIIHEIDLESLIDAELRAASLAMKNYTRYKAGVDLANLIYYELMKAGGREAKRLGNLQIERQGPALLTDLNKIRQHLMEQFLYWEGRLMYIVTGSVKPTPVSVVRGNSISPFSLPTRTF